MKKRSDHYLELLQVSYENDKTVQAIIRFSGIAEFFRHFVSDRVKNIRVDRTKTFFNELREGNIALTEEVAKTEDFLHKFYISYKAAINTRRREKIKMFARLLKSSLSKEAINNVDIFEDYLNVLDELSYREIKALVLLDSFYETPKTKDENEFKWTQKFWDDFEVELQEEINIPKELINDFMTRITRTGLFRTLDEYIWSDKESEGILTPSFKHLKKYAIQGS